MVTMEAKKRPRTSPADSSYKHAKYGVKDAFRAVKKAPQAELKLKSAIPSQRDDGDDKKGQDGLTRICSVLDEVYDLSVKNPKCLNKYKGFSDEVYGETNQTLINHLVHDLPIKDGDVFVDLGSGIGQVVLQVAMQRKLELGFGIEYMQNPSEYADTMLAKLPDVMQKHELAKDTLSPVELVRGDFLKDQRVPYKQADVIFVNNFAFSPQQNLDLLHKMQETVKDSCTLVSYKAFVLPERRSKARAVQHLHPEGRGQGSARKHVVPKGNTKITEFMPKVKSAAGGVSERKFRVVREGVFEEGGVSWTAGPMSYFVHKLV